MSNQPGARSFSSHKKVIIAGFPTGMFQDAPEDVNGEYIVVRNYAAGVYWYEQTANGLQVSIQSDGNNTDWRVVLNDNTYQYSTSDTTPTVLVGSDFDVQNATLNFNEGGTAEIQSYTPPLKNLSLSAERSEPLAALPPTMSATPYQFPFATYPGSTSVVRAIPVTMSLHNGPRSSVYDGRIDQILGLRLRNQPGSSLWFVDFHAFKEDGTTPTGCVLTSAGRLSPNTLPPQGQYRFVAGGGQLIVHVSQSH